MTLGRRHCDNVPSRSFLILIHWTQGWGRSWSCLSLNLLNDISWYSLITSLVSSANEACQWHKKRTHAPGKAKFFFLALLRNGFKPFNDLMSFSKVGLLAKSRQVLGILPLIINPSQLKWGARPHVQSMFFEIVELAQNVHAILFVLLISAHFLFCLGCAGRKRRYKCCAFWSLFTHFEFASTLFVFLFVSSFAYDCLVKLLLMPTASIPLSSVRICHTRMRRSSIVETEWRFVVGHSFWVNIQRSWRWRGIMSNISENQFNENQLSDALAVVGATIVSSVGWFVCVLMFSSPVGGLCYYGAPSQESFALGCGLGLMALLCVQYLAWISFFFFLFVFVFHLLVRGTWDLVIHCFPLSIIYCSQAGLFLEAASGAGLIHLCFFMKFFAAGVDLAN